jgi:TRAP-type uncharacterized transport system substrate-binding protein
MRRTIRETFIEARVLLATALPFILISLVLLWGAYLFLKPTPPKRIVMATGSEQGAYANFGLRYAEELKRNGIEVVLRTTAGSRENLRLLRDPKEKVDIAFVQGGSSETMRLNEDEQDAGLVSLGSMFYEPVWLYYRADVAKKIAKDGVLRDVAQLRGLRVNTGVRGSGIPGITNRLLAANLMDRTDIKPVSLDTTHAAVALLNGEIDVLALVSAPEAPIVQMLLQTPGIQLFEFSQAEAYSRRYRYLNPVTLPRGVVDLSRNAPPRDISMIAATCSLVARPDIHPALVQLFVQAATKIHGGGGWMSHAGQFPSPNNTEFPVTRDAERYYRNGPPLLQRYLPFWLANLVDRMWVALLSIMVVLIPVARVLPPLYAFGIRRRIFRWYRILRQIEDDLANGDKEPEKLRSELDKLDEKAERISVPLSYTDELYRLRQHIRLVRTRLPG